MKYFVRVSLLFLAVWLQLSGVSLAKQVFFKDGAVLECESFWKRNGQIAVKVNRDVLLEFDPAEVNLRRTFRPVKQKVPVQEVKLNEVPAASQAAPAAAAPEAGARTAPGQDVTKTGQGKLSAATAKTAASAAESATQPAPAGSPAAAKTSAADQPAPGGVATPVPAAKEAAQPEPADAGAEPAAPLTRQEYERRTKENAQMVAEAIRKNDQGLMKKALEAQRSLAQQQKEALKAGQGAGGSAGKAEGKADGEMKPEPVWFKYFLMLAVSVVLIIVACWVVFVKAGQSGWKSLVPFYNMYVLMLISGKPGWWFILLLVPVVGLAINLLAMLSLAEKFGRSPVFGVGLAFLPMIFFPLLAFGGSKYGGSVQEELNFSFSEEPPAA